MGAPQPARYTSQVNASTRNTVQNVFLKPMLKSLLRVHVHGRSNVNHLQAPFIVFGNHSSHFDAALILNSLPNRLSRQIATGAAADFFYDKWWKSAPMNLFFNGFPIDRGKSGTTDRRYRGLAAALLSEGVPLMIFPEGTRSRTGAMAPFKLGVASLCVANGCPALPVALVGAFEAWPHNQRTPPVGRPEVHVVIGHPLTPRPGELAHEFNERMRRQTMELHDHTARAYGRKTLAEYEHHAALESGTSQLEALRREAKERAEGKEKDRD